MTIGETIGIAVLCAVATTGCAILPFDDTPMLNADQIRLISIGRTKECRFIAQVSADSSYPQDADVHSAALERVRAKAAEQSADAIAVRSYQLRSGQAETRAMIIADAYRCKGSDGRR
jgi:hypothetical protein